MKKVITAILLLLILCMPVLQAAAAQGGPEIILHPQNPYYPEYAVAIYTVKAEGTNLSATWYLEWMDRTFKISEFGGAMQPWEAYAGEAYGARQLDDNTFIYLFEGIGAELDGAYIWCEISDGTNTVTTQRARIFVGDYSMPPEILSIPSYVEVEQGEMGDVRCVAKSPDESQLSFLWYETDTGKFEDMRAVNRGTETSDFMLCDTSAVGIRNYICMVQTDNGGLVLSSLVTVNVTEKVEETTVPTTDAPETTAPAEETEPSEETQPTEATKPTAASPGPQSTTPENTTVPTVPVSSDNAPADTSVPWWAIVIIGLFAAILGVLVALILTRKKS